eukprot:12414649-Karenia_brevis.AAC.1
MEVERRVEQLKEDNVVVNRVMREVIGKGVAAEMIQRAQELSKEGVIVEAPTAAREAIAAASS